MTKFPFTSRRDSRFGPLLPTKTLVGFWIAISAAVVVALLSYGAHRASVDSAACVTHSLDVIEQLQLLLSTVRDAETGQRGFLLTGDEKYIRPYTKATMTLAGEIASTRALVANNPEQARRLRTLDHLRAEKMAELAQTIALRGQGDAAGALAIVRMDRGVDLMEAIRAITAEMMGEERRALAISQPKALSASRISSLVTLGGAALVLAFIVAAAVRTSRDYRERQIQAWIRAGQVGLSERIHDEQHLDPLGNRALEFLAEYLGAQSGAAYLPEPGGHFRRLATFGVAGEPDPDLVRGGDGLVEQAAKENRAVHVQGVPAGHRPTELLVAPASVDGVVHAVIELGFSRHLEAADRELMSRVSESLGVAVRSSESRTRLEALLEETQRQAEELRNQQQALRLSNQEHARQASSLRESRSHSRTQRAEIEQTNSRLEEQTKIVKQQKNELSIFEGANFSSIPTDVNGVIQIFNVGSERMLGFTADEVINKITPADISDPQELIARAEAMSVELGSPIAPGFEALVCKASRGIEDNYELTYIRKDGSRFPAVVAVTAQRDADGAIIGYLLIGTDNTARKQIEADQTVLAQRLRDHQFYTRSLFESNIDALMTTDAAGIITDVNKQMEALTGGTRDELIGAPFKTFFTDPVRADAGIKLALSKRKVTDYELTVIDRDGKETVVSYNATTFYDRDRRLQGVFAAVREIAERKHYERSLREATRKAEYANSAKSEFLANMSHEIRTPLNAVVGLGYLLEHTALSEDQRQLLTKIQFGGRALLGVINNVLDLSKIEAGEMSVEEEPFHLPEVAGGLSPLLAPQAAARGIELIVRSAPTLPRMVNGDASRLRQILTNLLGNSIKFTEAGHVELKVFCAEQNADRIRLRCTVQDTGIGIEPDALERLFTPFTQADASTTRRFGGTGLGLSIARRFVELMGGEIGVTSTVAVGSAFWIEIPLRIAHDIDGRVSERGLRICVVDSSGDAPEPLVAMARALGWSPQAAETGEQLLGVMSDTQPSEWPDVLIVERRLHDMDAQHLIARLEKEYTHGKLPPVIVVGDHEKSFEEQEHLMRSMDVLLVRPFTSSALFNAVDAAVSKGPDNVERLLQLTNFDDLRAQWLAGVHVLVVDDNDINLEVAQRILEKQGAIVTTCSDGLAAVENVRVHHELLDIVLMDVQMPTLDGNEAARRIRNELQLSKLPILALTAGALVGERQRALEAGMNDFISKPFDPPALIRKVRG